MKVPLPCVTAAELPREACVTVSGVLEGQGSLSAVDPVIASAGWLQHRDLGPAPQPAARDLSVLRLPGDNSPRSAIQRKRGTTGRGGPSPASSAKPGPAGFSRPEPQSAGAARPRRCPGSRP